MEDLRTYLEMGGYAAFVWSAYGLSIGSLIGILVLTQRTLKAREREFEELKANRRSAP